MRRILEALGHKQDKTQVKTDNSTTSHFVNNTVKMKRSKTWDMRWNWLREKHQKKIFDTLWEKGTKNKADLFTKIHPPAHMKEKRKDYILKGFSVEEIVYEFKKKQQRL